jgi:hypothetical protein
MLPDALKVMDAWGFTYKSQFAWAKNVRADRRLLPESPEDRAERAALSPGLGCMGQ